MYFSEKKKKKLSAQPKAYVSLKPCLEKPKPQGLLDGRLETSSPIRSSDYVDLTLKSRVLHSLFMLMSLMLKDFGVLLASLGLKHLCNRTPPDKRQFACGHVFMDVCCRKFPLLSCLTLESIIH